MPAFAISSAFLKPCSWDPYTTDRTNSTAPSGRRFFSCFFGSCFHTATPYTLQTITGKIQSIALSTLHFYFFGRHHHYKPLQYHYFSKWQKPLFTFKASTSLRYTNQYLLYGHTSFFSTFLQQIWLPYLNKGLRCIPEAFALV